MKLENAFAYYRAVCPVGTSFDAFIERNAAAGAAIAIALLAAKATYQERLEELTPPAEPHVS